MNKSELVDAIAKDTGLTKKDTETFVKSFAENVAKALEKKEDVQLIGFGTFTTVERAAREGFNPAKKEKTTIPASIAPKFKPGKALKDRVNK